MDNPLSCYHAVHNGKKGTEHKDVYGGNLV